MAWSSFTIGVESRTEEHKIVQSGGSVECEDKGWGNKCVWKPMGFPTKSVQKLRVVTVGGCDSWKDMCTCSPTLLYRVGDVWWGEGRQSPATTMVSTFDYGAPWLNYTEWGLKFIFTSRWIDLRRKYSNLSMRYWISSEFSDLQTWVNGSASKNPKAVHVGPFVVLTYFFSRALGSKWWKTDSIRLLNCLNECTQLVGRLQHHCYKDSRCVYSSNMLTSTSSKTSSFLNNARKSYKFSR